MVRETVLLISEEEKTPTLVVFLIMKGTPEIEIISLNSGRSAPLGENTISKREYGKEFFWVS